MSARIREKLFLTERTCNSVKYAICLLPCDNPIFMGKTYCSIYSRRKTTVKGQHRFVPLLPFIASKYNARFFMAFRSHDMKKPPASSCKRLLLKEVHHIRSKIPAAPIPVPTHIVTMPYFRFLRRNACTTVAERIAPVAPSGWPSAIAPPIGLTLAGSSPRS